MKASRDRGLPLEIYESVSHEKKLRSVPFSILASPSEIICVNDMLKEISGQSLGGSGFVRGMKSWSHSFNTYVQKLEVIERLLSSGTPLTPDQLRQIKEIVINFPENFAEESSETLEEKFITTNMANLMTSVLKSVYNQNQLKDVLLALKKDEAAAKK
jgi:hypothetical protein